MGQSPPGETYNEAGDGIPFYQGRADFDFRYPKVRMFCTAPTRFASAGDTLVSVRAPVGDMNMVVKQCCIGRGVAAVRHKSGSRSYTYYFMRSLKPEFARFEAEGTVFGSIGKADFQRIACVVAPPQVVEAFEELMFPFDQRIENNEKESLTLDAIRDALLPKLMSGEIRVKDTEKIIARTL
jgi:type I restriction enzyme S subunit